MRKRIIAKDGYVFTDGTIYAKVIDLAEDRNEAEFHEITEAEYEAIIKKEGEVLNETESDA